MVSMRYSWVIVAIACVAGCNGSSSSNPGDDSALDAMTDDGASSDGPGTDDDLASLPADTGGTHTAHPLGTTTAAFGYYIYLPAGYETNTQSYPLLVFLHGKGERGDGTTQLARVLGLGITKLIETGAWHPTYPMIVVSPQFPNPDGAGNDNNWGDGNPANLHGLIEHVMSTYRVNDRRVYLTGLSHGGNGVYDYLLLQSEATSYLAAAAPIAAYGPNAHFDVPAHTPIWVFVGENDTTNFNTSKNFVAKYNAQMPPPQYPAKFTAYPNAPHDVWTRTYNLSGMGMEDPVYDPYDVSLFDWFFSYKRPL